MVAMARPVVVVVDDEDASRQALARELEGRYGAHYRIMSAGSPEEGLAGLEQLRDLLTRNSVPFGFQRADSEEGSAALQRLGLDPSSGPVVALHTGVVLADPANTEVAEALGVDIRPAETTYDVVIVGAGPAGLAAAVYGASEGLRTALLEREAFGGQAGTSSLIRNYLGFPRGVSGAELASRAYEQAWMFGTKFVYGNPATSLAIDGDLCIVGLQDGSAVTSRTVVIATGVSYRRLAGPGLESLAGAGVFYGAATTEAQALAGKRAFVVGGGNSAGQAALHVSKYAQHVDPRPLGVPGSEYVPVPDSRDRSRVQHRGSLLYRGRERRRRWTPGAAHTPASGHWRFRDRAGRRAVRPDRRSAIHRMAARRGWARPMGLHPDRPGP